MVLPTLRMKVLYLISDVGAEVGSFLATTVWAISLTIPETFIVVLPTYQALLSEGSPYFWAACWWIIALIKLSAIVTGNPYLRRFCFLLGLIAWVVTTAVLVGEYKMYNVLVGFAGTFAIVSWWNYIKAGLILQQHIEYVDGDGAATHSHEPLGSGDDN